MLFVYLNGPAGSGKNTIANWMTEACGFNQWSFAAPMKAMVQRAFFPERAGETEEYWEDLKRKNVPVFHGMSLRELYIWFSEVVIKPQFGQDFWGKQLANKVLGALEVENVSSLWGDNFSQRHLHVITDCGFEAEVWPVVRTFARDTHVILQVHRQGFSFDGDSRRFVELYDSWPSLMTRSFYNPDGNLAESKSRLQKVLQDWERSGLLKA